MNVLILETLRPTVEALRTELSRCYRAKLINRGRKDENTKRVVGPKGLNDGEDMRWWERRTGEINGKTVVFYTQRAVGQRAGIAVYFKWDGLWYSLPAFSVPAIGRVGILDAEKSLDFKIHEPEVVF